MTKSPLLQVSVVVATWNRPEHVRRLATQVQRQAFAADAFEIVVVDDGSHDGTAIQAERAGARVVRLERNAGKGSAVAAGIRATTAPVVLLCDADLEETAGALQALLEPVIDGRADMTIAAPPQTGPSGFGLVESFARWGIKRLTGVRLDRPLSGQRAFRRTGFPAGSPAAGFGLEVGMTIDALRRGDRILEIPLAFRHARTGRDPAGFAHRARQGTHVVAALAARAGKGSKR